MKRSLQEVVELVVFGLIALLIGTGVLWLLGWVLGLVGLLFKVVAGLIWWLLRFIVPVAIVAGLVYFLVRLAQNQGKNQTEPVAPPAAPAAPAAPTPVDTANPTSSANPTTTAPAVLGSAGAPQSAPAASQVEDTAPTIPFSAEGNGSDGGPHGDSPTPSDASDHDASDHHASDHDASAEDGDGDDTRS